MPGKENKTGIEKFREKRKRYFNGYVFASLLYFSILVLMGFGLVSMSLEHDLTKDITGAEYYVIAAVGLLVAAFMWGMGRFLLRQADRQQRLYIAADMKARLGDEASELSTIFTHLTQDRLDIGPLRSPRK